MLLEFTFCQAIKEPKEVRSKGLRKANIICYLKSSKTRTSENKMEQEQVTEKSKQNMSLEITLYQTIESTKKIAKI